MQVCFWRENAGQLYGQKINKKSEVKKGYFFLFRFPPARGVFYISVIPMKKRNAYWRRLCIASAVEKNMERDRKLARMNCCYCKKEHTIYNTCNKGVVPPYIRSISFDTDYLQCTTPCNVRYREHVKWMLLWVIINGNSDENAGCPWIGLPLELFIFIYGFIEHDEITFYLYYLNNEKNGIHNTMKKHVFKLPRLTSIYRFRNELSEHVSTISSVDYFINAHKKSTMYFAPHKLDIHMVKDGMQSKERLPVISEDIESLYRYIGERYAIRILIVYNNGYSIYNKNKEVAVRIFDYPTRHPDWTVDLITTGPFLVLNKL